MGRYYSTQPVGQKLPNPWGLYDMHGQVSQWCQDWFGFYPGGSVVDPQGPATGTERIVRSGSWYDDP
jgi:formylglycine-generating enzyme required for sulfatase activity